MIPRYKLRTLLILLAILPPLLWVGWTKYELWKADRERKQWEHESLENEKRWLAAELLRRLTARATVTNGPPGAATSRDIIELEHGKAP